MKTAEQSNGLFQVGDHVRFTLGMRKVSGIITEDRGNIGRGGRRLYIVATPEDPEEPAFHLVPAEEMERASDSILEHAPTKEEITRYLKKGGLVYILMNNSSGGRNQPHVWLCRNAVGNVTHSFSEKRGIIGGAAIPFWTLYHNSKIFAPKMDKVIEFLASFGLNEQEAMDVIEAVGTAPR